MKRIDVITKGKSSLITSLINRKSARVMRGVEQAIDYAEDKVESLKDKAVSILNSLEFCASGEDTASLNRVIQQYVEAIKEQKDWEDTIEAIKLMKAQLEEDVEVSEEEKK